MKKSKKYDFSVAKEGDKWIVQIIRRISSKKTHVTKQQGGFASEDEARQWGESAAAELLKSMNLKAQKKRRAKNNEQDEDIVWSFFKHLAAASTFQRLYCVHRVIYA